MWRRVFSAVTTKSVLQAYRDYFALLCMPVVVASLAYRGLIGSLHLTLTGKYLGLEVILSIFVYMPMGLYAETVVAAMYLYWRRAKKPAIAAVREVLSYPGLGRMLTRFVLGLCGWCVVALLVGAVLYFITMLFYGVATTFFSGMLGVTHPGVTSKLPHSTLFFLVSFVGSYGYLIGQYSFVLPMFAIEKGGSADSFRRAVARAKRHLDVLRVVTVVEYVSITLITQGFLLLEKRWWSRPAVIGFAVGAAVVAGVVTTYFEMLKTEMAAQDVETEPADGLEQPAQGEGWAVPSTAL